MFYNDYLVFNDPRAALISTMENPARKLYPKIEIKLTGE